MKFGPSFFAALLAGTLVTAGCRSTVEPPPAWLPPGVSGLYNWQSVQSDSEALAELAQQPDNSAQTLCALHRLRRAATVADAEQQRNILQQRVPALTAQVAADADVFNTFVLGEVCSEPATGFFDRQLAAALYSYSAERGFAPAAMRLGAMLMTGDGIKSNLPLAGSLLQYAWQQQLPEAGFYLYKLYKLQNDPRAEAVLSKAAAGGSINAAGVLALRNDPATARIFADRAADVAWFFAMQKNIAPTERLKFLRMALENGHERAPAALAFFYQEKPAVQPLMAINAAILEVHLSGGRAESYQLLQELDEQHQLAMAALVMWQNQLQSRYDFRRCCQDMELELVDLVNPVAERALRARNLLTQTLQNDPEKFFLSGITFRLRFYGLTDSEINALLARTPEEAASTIPATVTMLLVAAEQDDWQNQARLAQKLLDMLKKMPPEPTAGSMRFQLGAAIPGAALLEAQKPQLNDPASTFALSWNLAVDLYIDALLSGNQPQQAARILEQYPRFQLPPYLKTMERNLVRRFARHLQTQTPQP